MGELASRDQLRMSLLRWALVTVPGIVFLGFLSGRLADSGYGNAWFDALVKPAIMPPGFVFGMVWSILYVLMGIALAMILNARRAPGRARAIGLFAGQLLLNLAWSPLFFAAHKMLAAFGLILLILILATATTFAFDRIRKVAAWLMLPYLVWLSFAAILNWQTYRLNPGGGPQGAAQAEIRF